MPHFKHFSNVYNSYLHSFAITDENHRNNRNDPDSTLTFMPDYRKKIFQTQHVPTTRTIRHTTYIKNKQQTTKNFLI